MVRSCCICGYRMPFSKDYPFDKRIKELTMCADCKSYLELYESGGEEESKIVAEKYLKMALSSNGQMDSRVRMYLQKLLGLNHPENDESGRLGAIEDERKQI